MTRLRLLVGGLLLCLLGTVHADIFRPAYLEVRELGDDRYDVLWKVPALGTNQRLSVYVIFPEGTENLTESQPFITNGAWLERWRIHFPGGLVGQTIRIEGNATGVSDIIARVEKNEIGLLSGRQTADAVLHLQRVRHDVEAIRAEHGDLRAGGS